MSIISFDSSLFNIDSVNGPVESPKSILTKITQAIFDKCSKDVAITYSDCSSVIAKNDKKIASSAWKFSLKDLTVNGPLNCFIESGHDFVIVWNIQFFDGDRLLSDISPNANITCAMGYTAKDENRVLFMLGTKAMMFARTLSDDAEMFFADIDPMVDIVANAIPVKIDKKTKLWFNGIVPVKDYNVIVSYNNGKLTAVIPHRYTMTDNVYGARYSNYSRSVDFTDVNSVSSFNWDSLWNDLYENRNGTCTYRGSLGS